MVAPLKSHRFLARVHAMSGSFPIAAAHLPGTQGVPLPPQNAPLPVRPGRRIAQAPARRAAIWPRLPTRTSTRPKAQGSAFGSMSLWAGRTAPADDRRRGSRTGS
jgi:hypothetical protein